MVEALVALGGNIGDVRDTLNCAVAMFCDGQEVKLIRRSADYRTPPWGVEDQPIFVNACIRVATALRPRPLLERAHIIERQFGRDRSNEQKWGPRPIDIDLLAYGAVVCDEPGLSLPHPRLFERAFVLVPLAEIAPDWTINGISIRQGLARVDQTGIERLS